jgi:beta-glucosidase
MKSTPKIHLKRPWRPALLLGVATTLAAGAWLLGATAANAAVGTDLGKVALNPGSGANTLTPTWSTLEGCPAGFQGSADLEIVINSASNPRNTVSNNVSGVSAPFSGTLQASMGDIKSAFGFANGSTQEWVVFCDANPNVGGSAKPVMDTYVTWSADGSSYTETNTPPATPTATALTASPSPAKAGQNVTLTSTVTAASGTPVGTVQFKDGGTAIGSPVTVNASGVATTTTTFSATGTHTLSAVFTPADSNAFQPSTGSLDEAVTNTTVTVTPPPSQTTTVGGSADLQVNATDTAGGTLSFAATGLPAGVSISSTGRIIGWPTTAGTYNVTVTATDALQVSGSATFSWTVNSAPNTGPAGQVWLQNGGKCLDDPGGQTVNGTRLQIWTCLGNTNQRWTVVQDGTLRAHGTSSCLAEAGTGNGAAVVLEACNGGSAQRWQVGTNGELVNTASGRCLDDTGLRTANGTLLQIWACGGGSNQHWIPAAAPVMSGIPGMCMDDPGANTANGTRLDISACSGGGNQDWTVQPDGSIRLAGKCLDVVGYGTTSGSPLDLYTCRGTSNQHWKIVPEGPFGSEVVNPASGRCLADAGDATANGSKLTIQNCQAQDPGTIWHVL